MSGLNIENINKVIDFVRTRTWRTECYMSTAQCMTGIVSDALYGDQNFYVRNFSGGAGWLCSPRQLGGTWDAVGSPLFGLRDTDADVHRDWHHFEAMSLEDQNDAIISMLEHLLSTGKVVWSKVNEYRDQVSDEI